MFLEKFVALEKRTDGKFLNAGFQKMSRDFSGARLLRVLGEAGNLNVP
jgi:hypothetical protein